MENLFLDLSGKFSFSVFLFFSFSANIPKCLRKYSGIYSSVSKTEKQKNWKTEKLKNWIHVENLFLDLSGKFSFSVFQFLRKYSEMSPEIFRNSSVSKTEKLKNRKTEKQKNWKTEKLNPYGEFLPGSLWKIQFFSFSVFQFLRKYSEMSAEIFRNSSVSKTQKQKNWKPESTPRLDKELKELLGSQRCELNAVALVTLATILKGVEEYKHVVLHLHYLHSSFPKLKSQVFGPSMWEAMMFLELGSPLDSSMLFPGRSYFCHFCIASGPCHAGLSIWFDQRTPLPWFQKSWEKGLRTDGMMGRNTISKSLKSKANDDYEN